MSKSKICLILPYFGKLPSYWGGFIDSCRENRDIDFLIISDCVAGSLGENIRVIESNWTDFKTSIETQLSRVGIHKVCLHRPYKLCDFKPCYGFIFQEYLHDYDYWGHIDCDLVFGNLRNCFDKIKIERYDRIFPVGHLSLYRNTEKINKLFADKRYIREFRRVAQSSMPHNFDEAGINEICRKEGLKFCEERHEATFSIYDDTFRWKNMWNPTRGELFVKCKDGSTCSFYENENGEIEKAEALYFHFMTKKGINIPFNLSSPYCITHSGVYELRDESADEIKSALKQYTLSTPSARTKFVKSEIARFRKESIVKFSRELKYNPSGLLYEFVSRFRPWIAHRFKH